MPDPNITVRGNNTVKWGTNGVYATGIITKGNKKRASDKKVILDNDGNAAIVIYFNHRNECSFTMIRTTSDPEFEIGDIITIGGATNCIVDDISDDYTQGSEQQLTVSATAYDGITATP